MRDVIEALAALARVTAAHYVTISKYPDGRVGVGLSHGSDAAARDTAQALCITLDTVGNANEEWLRGETTIGEITVSVYGVHHKRVAPPEPAAISAAVEQARKAVR